MNICAIYRNESLYLREWIEYHRLVGVEKFYLYNNFSEDDYLSILQPYIDNGVVSLIDWPKEKPCQLPAYQHYIDSHRGSGCTAFVDIDEFLFPVQHNTIQEALVGLPQSAIGVNWCYFGSSGKQEWEDAPVIERFTWRSGLQTRVNRHIKSIIWMDQDVQVGGDPHFFHVAGGTFDENGQPVGGPFTATHSSSLLRINHYGTKSRQEWLKRVALGKPDRASMDVDPEWYDGRQQQEVDDREIWRFLPQLEERLK